MKENNSTLMWVLFTAYSIILVLSNWFDARLVSLFTFNSTAGVMVLPLTFMLGDVITEVYGYKNARFAILMALCFNIIFLIYGQFVIHLPDPSFPNHNADFNLLFSMATRVTIASIVSYIISEPINSIILAKIKVWTHGKYKAIRFILSSFIASAIDSVIFTTCAFYGTIHGASLINLIVMVMTFKSIIECIVLPFSVKFSNWLKEKEGIDIYDRDTDFKIFDFDRKYKSSNNEFDNT